MRINLLLGLSFATPIVSEPAGFKVGFKQSASRTELLGTHGLRASDLFTELPPGVDWRTDSKGRNMLTKLRNQHIPNYCGACWSFAATSALSDRINIVSGHVRQTGLSMQVILNCDKYDDGCHGGDPLTAYQFIHEAGGIPDETCQLYVAEGHDTGRRCDAVDVCMNCDAERGCFAQPQYPVWTIESYGLVNGTTAMMAELQRGPIACSIAVTDAFFTLMDFSIFKDVTGATELDHSISIVGYGEEKGIPFWIGRNSWGEYWGESGFFRLLRGVNNLGVESNCQWAIPANQGSSIIKTIEEKEVAETYMSGCIREPNEWSEFQLPDHRIADVPSSYDFRNISGSSSFWTEDKNQHAPAYCGSCWAEAVSSALSDRLSLLKGGAWPPINLSPQVLINCRMGGDCQGGSPSQAYARIAQHGLPDETCQSYRAMNENSCDTMHMCEECFAGDTPATFWPGTCHAVTKFSTWYVSSFGPVSGAAAMKAEIFARGPITCGLFATRKFIEYKGGHVFEESHSGPGVNHEISIAGWGVDEHGEFWIGRNSWGTYWGETGWFRIRMHRDNLNVETDCSWGVPSSHLEEVNVQTV